MQEAREVKARIEKMLEGIQVTRCIRTNGYSGHKCLLCNAEHYAFQLPKDRVYPQGTYGEDWYDIAFTDLLTQMKSGEQTLCADETKCLARQYQQATSTQEETSS